MESQELNLRDHAIVILTKRECPQISLLISLHIYVSVSPLIPIFWMNRKIFKFSLDIL
jgi:hypothetical protein